MSAVTDDLMGDAIIEELSRSTLPIRFMGGRPGTAFLYNELVESRPDADRVREWIVTVDRLTRGPVLEVRLRPEMIELGPAADYLALVKLQKHWARRHGAAVVVSRVLHEHAERKGWQWRTQEVREGIAGGTERLSAALADGTRRAWALGHLAEETIEVPGEPRPQALVSSGVTRDPDRAVRWRGEVPMGFAGAPVFVAEQRGRVEFALLCIGLLGSDDRNATVITFDTVRDLIRRTVQRSRDRDADVRRDQS
jgi:hypothetical protein